MANPNQYMSITFDDLITQEGRDHALDVGQLLLGVKWRQQMLIHTKTPIYPSVELVISGFYAAERTLADGTRVGRFVLVTLGVFLEIPDLEDRRDIQSKIVEELLEYAFKDLKWDLLEFDTAPEPAQPTVHVTREMWEAFKKDEDFLIALSRDLVPPFGPTGATYL